MMGEKIEFYGEQLSILAIAKRIGISRETLNKYYMSTGNIYETEKICKKIIEDKQESLIDYNGEKLAIQTIAKRVGIKDAKTLKKYYKQIGDIYKAIEKCNESKIEYHGKQLTLDAIAKKAKEKFRNVVELTMEMDKVIMDLPVKPENAKKVLDVLYDEPIVSRKKILELIDIKPTTLNVCINALKEKNIIIETTGYSRNQVFAFQKYIDLFLK